MLGAGTALLLRTAGHREVFRPGIGSVQIQHVRKRRKDSVDNVRVCLFLLIVIVVEDWRLVVVAWAVPRRAMAPFASAATTRTIPSAFTVPVFRLFISPAARSARRLVIVFKLRTETERLRKGGRSTVELIGMVKRVGNRARRGFREASVYGGGYRRNVGYRHSAFLARPLRRQTGKLHSVDQRHHSTLRIEVMDAGNCRVRVRERDPSAKT